MQAKFQIKFLAYCGKKYGAPDLLISHYFYVNKSQVYSKHPKILTMTTNKPKKKRVRTGFCYKLFRDGVANAKFV